MKTTRYFVEQVLRKRPYLNPQWCLTVIGKPFRSEAQNDGRVRFWGRIIDPCDGQLRILRVITLDDGETIHNAFFDRSYRETKP